MLPKTLPRMITVSTRILSVTVIGNVCGITVEPSGLLVKQYNGCHLIARKGPSIIVNMFIMLLTILRRKGGVGDKTYLCF